MMRVVFDTSILVAGALVEHAHQARARVWLDAAVTGQVEAATTSHALAELWATLTALPVNPRIGPVLAAQVTERYAQKLHVINLGWEHCRRAIRRCGERGLRSGAVYDALHLVGAERWSAEWLLTFNTRHFERLVATGHTQVLAPPDPPKVPA